MGHLMPLIGTPLIIRQHRIILLKWKTLQATATLQQIGLLMSIINIKWIPIGTNLLTKTMTCTTGHSNQNGVIQSAITPKSEWQIILQLQNCMSTVITIAISTFQQNGGIIPIIHSVGLIRPTQLAKVMTLLIIPLAKHKPTKHLRLEIREMVQVQVMQVIVLMQHMVTRLGMRQSGFSHGKCIMRQS